MHKSTLLFIVISLGLQGCSVLKPHVKDLPPRPIMEEQDTPFVFKQGYQTEGLYSTQVLVETPNDFVDIQSSVQYVWWSPSASLNVFAEIKSEEPPTMPEEAETETKPQALGTQASHEPPVTPINPTTTAFVCAMIMCDGSETPCGAIELCDGQVCDEDKRSEYDCMNETCSQVHAKTSIEVAKGDIKCPDFPERFMCPQKTECKFAPEHTDGTVSIKAAQRLFMEGEDDE